jgi:hypothetical protein
MSRVGEREADKELSCFLPMLLLKQDNDFQ